ncbi:MAG TPA: DUF2834 domain-containing protein [Gammaproteobacteria bacterium]
MKWKWLYLLLTIPGAVVPWCYLSGFLGSGDATLPLFFRHIFVNDVSSAVATDLLISALVFFLFVHLEGRRLAMGQLWLYPLFTLAIGLSFGLPLFLYFRARVIEQQSEATT